MNTGNIDLGMQPTRTLRRNGAVRIKKSLSELDREYMSGLVTLRRKTVSSDTTKCTSDCLKEEYRSMFLSHEPDTRKISLQSRLLESRIQDEDSLKPIGTKQITPLPKRNSSVGTPPQVTQHLAVNTNRCGIPSIIEQPRQRRASFSFFRPSHEEEGHSMEETPEKISNALLHLETTGLPVIPESLKSAYPQNIPLACTSLEDWTELVSNYKNMTEEEQTQQMALMELITTELNYINQLSAIMNVYVAVLLYLKSPSRTCFITVDEDRMFGNIGEVYRASCRFFNSCILLPYTQTKVEGLPLDASLLKFGFTRIHEDLSAYDAYCQKLSYSMDYLRDLEKSNQLFQKYLQWCEKQSQDFREGLRSLLAKPYQRITKYALLLQRIKKHTLNEAQLNDLEEMHQCVTSFVNHINEMKHKREALDELKSLKEILAPYKPYNLPRGEDYERFIFSRWLTHDWLLHAPYVGPGIREKILSGNVKFREGDSKWSEAVCYLFTDLFLACKLTKRQPDKQVILESPVRLDKILPQRHSEGTLVLVIFNDFCWPMAFYSLSSDSKSIQEWLDKIREAKINFLKASGYSDSAIPPISPDSFSITFQSSISNSPSPQTPRPPFPQTCDNVTPSDDNNSEEEVHEQPVCIQWTKSKPSAVLAAPFITAQCSSCPPEKVYNHVVTNGKSTFYVSEFNNSGKQESPKSTFYVNMPPTCRNVTEEDSLQETHFPSSGAISITKLSSSSPLHFSVNETSNVDI